MLEKSPANDPVKTPEKEPENVSLNEPIDESINMQVNLTEHIKEEIDEVKNNEELKKNIREFHRTELNLSEGLNRLFDVVAITLVLGFLVFFFVTVMEGNRISVVFLLFVSFGIYLFITYALKKIIIWVIEGFRESKK